MGQASRRVDKESTRHTHTPTPEEAVQSFFLEGTKEKVCRSPGWLRTAEPSCCPVCLAGLQHSGPSFPRTHCPTSLHEQQPWAVCQWAWRCLQSVLLLAGPQQCRRRADGAPHSSSLPACPNRTGLLALMALLGSQENRWEAF